MAVVAVVAATAAEGVVAARDATNDNTSLVYVTPHSQPTKVLGLGERLIGAGRRLGRRARLAAGLPTTAQTLVQLAFACPGVLEPRSRALPELSRRRYRRSTSAPGVSEAA